LAEDFTGMRADSPTSDPAPPDGESAGDGAVLLMSMPKMPMAKALASTALGLAEPDLARQRRRGALSTLLLPRWVGADVECTDG
jgi:hypothetical protein